MSKIVPRGAGLERLLLEATLAHHVPEIASVTKPAASVTKPKGGRPAKYASRAQRQKAYRERRKAAAIVGRTET